MEVNEPYSVMPIVTLTSERFENYFGSDAVLRTFLTLAKTGRPHPYLIDRLSQVSVTPQIVNQIAASTIGFRLDISA